MFGILTWMGLGFSSNRNSFELMGAKSVWTSTVFEYDKGVSASLGLSVTDS
jgi:hypothetical protein